MLWKAMNCNCEKKKKESLLFNRNNYVKPYELWKLDGSPYNCVQTNDLYKIEIVT